MLSTDEIDEVIKQLKDSKGKSGYNIPEQTIRTMCSMTREIFMSEPMLLDLKAPINICGIQLF